MTTILERFEQNARRRRDARALAVFGAEGATWTWGEWERHARSFAAALIDSGCPPGSALAVLAGNHPVWPIADIGALMAGAVSVGIYPTSAPNQVRELLNDCGARAVVVDTAPQLAKVLAVRSALPNLRTVICASQAAADGVVSWDAWLKRGESALARHNTELDQRIADAAPDDIANLVYTSGSTGTPKGARISHRYITASAASICSTLDLTESDSALSFLPYCHASERIFGLYTRIAAGMSSLLVANTRDLWRAARQFEPTLFGGLPRFYEKIYEVLLAKAAALSAEQRVEWERGMALGRQRVERARRSLPADPQLEDQWQNASRLARATIAELLGARLRLATSGGATLPAEIAEYLAAAGLTVLGAYGLTEHLCVVMHRPHSCSFDSAGLPMPGTELRISAHGEIQIRRSALTFSGYHNQPHETRRAFTEDGAWLHTGDLGAIDAAGRLHITGREKDLIALSGGKKIAPAPIERRLTESPWIAQAILFGENRKYISALIALRHEYVLQWARDGGREHAIEALLLDAEVRSHVQRVIDAVNATLSQPEQIKRFALLPAELSAEQDELTPTLKLRRAVIAQKYEAQLEALYR